MGRAGREANVTIMAESLDSLYRLISDTAVKIGNVFRTATGLPATANTLPYVDSNSQLASGNIPFAIPMFAGVTDTSFSTFSIRGASTQSANELYHQTLVYGTVASTLTVSGLMRITVTDDTGNIANGAYYVPFGTLA